ncbi:unnamed protein product [Caenorhabditis angaria]|uniref:THAP-type domain-containing protein n=1 Tax=Caenorhabditis angaria TaxID=860376 RepID=A0A9P1MU15_9PELO|nr:unnamed protein product [Caenorhabditis angaria]
MEPQVSAKRFLMCQYCNKRVDQKHMTAVPYSANIRAKWMDILGPIFVENMKKYDNIGTGFGRICLAHFEENFKRRKPEQLPIRMSEKEEEMARVKTQKKSISEKYQKRRCCYCEKFSKEHCMTAVPVDQNVREKWIEILGESFAKNLENIKKAVICLTHFEGNLNHRKRYQLPVRMNEENEKKEEKEKEMKVDQFDEDEEEKEEEEYEIETINENPRFENAPENVPQNEKVDNQVEISQSRSRRERIYRMYNEELENMDYEEENGEFINDKNEIGLLRIKKEEPEIVENERVAINQSIQMNLMANEIEKPNEELEMKFEINREQSSNICRICNVIFNSSKQISILMETEILRRKSHRKVTCCYCQKCVDQEYTTEVPYLPNIQAKWIEILGQQFAENLEKFHQNGSKNFGRIFMRHFEGENKQRKMNQLPVKMREHEGNTRKKKMKHIDVYSNTFHKCCYCEKKMVKQNDMTRVLLVPNVRDKWIEILGKRFAENLKKSKYAFICLTHFNGFVKGLRNRLPVKMEEGNENEKEVEDEEEEKEDEEEDFEIIYENTGKNHLLANVVKNEQVEIIQRNCHHGELEEMDYENQINGQVENSLEMDNDVVEIEKNGLLTETGMANQEIGRLSKPRAHPNTKQFRCCYCEKSVERKYTTNVPTSPEIRVQWILILGPRFAENVNQYNKNGGRICITHFSRNFANRRKYELPIRMDEEDFEKETNDDKPSAFRKCCYCEKSVKQEETTRVPSILSVRQKWIDILGNRFADNLEKIKNACICRTHFKRYLKYQRNQLPVRMEDFEIIEEDNDVVEIEREVQRHIFETNQIGTGNRQNCRICKIELGSSIKTIPIPTDADVFIKWLEVFVEAGMTHQEIGGLSKQRSPANTNNSRCCYCGKLTEQRYMTNVPSTSEIRVQWIEVLGPRFAEKIKKYNKNGSFFGRICMTHFEGNITFRNKHALPIPMDEEDFEKEKEEIGIGKPSSQRIRTCCYCEKRVRQIDTVRVPRNQNVREKWIEILGDRFAESVKKLKYSVICSAHFKGFVKHRKKQFPFRMNDEKEEGELEIGFDNSLGNLPKNEKEDFQFERNINEEFENMDYEEDQEKFMVDHLDSIKNGLLEVKREEPETIEMDALLPIKLENPNSFCRFCETEISSVEIIEVPKNAEDLLKWYEIYGEKFIENIAKHPEPHFICMSHVFERYLEHF